MAVRRRAQVEPLRLVPATWSTGGSARSGLPSRSSRAAIRSRPRLSLPGDSLASLSSWAWTAGSSERARSATSRLGRLFARRQIIEQQSEAAAQLLAVDDHVDHAVLEQIFGALEAFRQLLADRVLDHPLAGEADQGAGLGDMDVAEHRIGSGDSAGGRIGEDDDIREARFLQLGD